MNFFDGNRYGIAKLILVLLRCHPYLSLPCTGQPISIFGSNQHVLAFVRAISSRPLAWRSRFDVFGLVILACPLFHPILVITFTRTNQTLHSSELRLNYSPSRLRSSFKLGRLDSTFDQVKCIILKC